jgi:hypothetical protein
VERAKQLLIYFKFTKKTKSIRKTGREGSNKLDLSRWIFALLLFLIFSLLLQRHARHSLPAATSRDPGWRRLRGGTGGDLAGEGRH